MDIRAPSERQTGDTRGKLMTEKRVGGFGSSELINQPETNGLREEQGENCEKKKRDDGEMLMQVSEDDGKSR